MEPDDEEGILLTCEKMDKLVQAEIDRGVDSNRIIIGGFSQGCAVSLVWGQIGKMRDKVGGVVLLAGYYPMADRIEALRKERGIDVGEKGTKKWFYVHGSKDILVPMRLFEQGKTELAKWIYAEDMEEHVYEGMGHNTDPRVLRDMLAWLNKVIPP
jgi:predicted esterase